MRAVLLFVWSFALCGVSLAAQTGDTFHRTGQSGTEAAATATLAESENSWLGYWERRTVELIWLVTSQPQDKASVWSVVLARIFELSTAEWRRPVVDASAIRRRLETAASSSNTVTADDAGWLVLKAAALLQHAEAELFATEHALSVHGAHVEMLHAMLLAGARRFDAEECARAWADACIHLLPRLRSSIEQALASKAHFLSVDCALQTYKALYKSLGGRAWLGEPGIRLLSLTEQLPISDGVYRDEFPNTTTISTSTTQSPQVIDLTGDGSLLKQSFPVQPTAAWPAQPCVHGGPDAQQRSTASSTNDNPAFDGRTTSLQTANRAVSDPCVAFRNQMGRSYTLTATATTRTSSDGSIQAPPNQSASQTQPLDAAESVRRTPMQTPHAHPETTQEMFSGVRRHAEATSVFFRACESYISALIGTNYAFLVAVLSGTLFVNSGLQDRLERAAGAVEMAQMNLGLAENALIAAGAVQTSSNIQRAARACITRPASNADVSSAVHNVSRCMIAKLGDVAVQASRQACETINILISHRRSLEAAQASVIGTQQTLYTLPPDAITDTHLLEFARAAAQFAMRHVAVQYTVARESLARANAIRYERSLHVLYTTANKFSA